MPDTKLRSRHARRENFKESQGIRLSSPSILDGDPIPSRHSVDGGNASPALSWSGFPDDTRSIAVTCEDPTGPRGRPFTLWILYNIPADVSGIPDSISKVFMPPEVPGAEQGVNDTGTVGYDGPAPPPGHLAHRYEFKVYGLDVPLNVPPDITRSAFEAAIANHVLALGELAGTFRR